MTKRAILVLEDGSIYEGFSFGAETNTCGEVVFNTSMTGYQEMLTDPSYAGQILIPTYPLIGNYGVNQEDNESRQIQVKGFAVRQECASPSHYLSKDTINQFLKDAATPGIYGLDTRAITRHLRSAGVMMGVITSTLTPQQALEQIKNTPAYDSTDFVKQVSTEKPYEWPRQKADREAKYNVVAVDCGLKYNILRLLTSLGCHVTAVPVTTPAADILAMKPDGILASPGPGDPELLDYAVETIRELAQKKPMMGICLGNQLIARAFGAKNFKLKFGHRGGNHPVKELKSGRVHITAQNHGYAVDANTLGMDLEVTHMNLNDNTVEGLRHRRLPVFAIQYHSEASPGPLDNTYLFEQFIEMMRDNVR